MADDINIHIEHTVQYNEVQYIIGRWMRLYHDVCGKTLCALYAYHNSTE